MRLIRVKGATVTHGAYWAGPFRWERLCQPKRLAWPDPRLIRYDQPTPSPICKDCRKALTRMVTKVDGWEEP